MADVIVVDIAPKTISTNSLPVTSADIIILAEKRVDNSVKRWYNDLLEQIGNSIVNTGALYI